MDEVCGRARFAETRRHFACRWKRADCHRDLVACVAPDAVHAVSLHFIRQRAVFGDTEVEVFEEGGDPGEEADAWDAAGFGLIEQGADEQAPGSVSLGLSANGDGADLSQMLAVDMESGAAEELAGVGFNDGEGVDVLGDLGVTPGEQSPVVGEAMD